MVAVPGYGHRHVLDAAAPFLRSEQVVVFSSHMSLAALYLAGLLRKRGVATPIAALGTTVTTGRQTGPDAVNVSSVRARLDVAVLPYPRPAGAWRSAARCSATASCRVMDCWRSLSAISIRRTIWR